MHEARLCLSLVDLAVAHLADASRERIVALHLEVGEVCGVVPEALEGAFPICAAGTPAADAVLRIERVPGRDLRLREMEVT